ncbi:MAG: hypothetical protein MHM6MM_001790 [Cercozoa sp. M6MM]
MLRQLSSKLDEWKARVSTSSLTVSPSAPSTPVTGPSTPPARRPSNAPVTPSARLRRKTAALVECLDAPIVDLDRLRSLAFLGLPRHLRSKAWRLLLDFPNETALWSEVLAARREAYRKFVEDLVVVPPENETSEDPLGATSDDGQWSKYFDDTRLREQVAKDIRRTMRSFSFLFHPLRETSASLTYPAHSDCSHLAKDPFDSDDDLLESEGTSHFGVLIRVCLVFARLNPGIRYVQGMNEILSRVYYVLASCPLGGDDADYAEADAFYCFTSLMATGLRDRFTKPLDADPTFGVMANCERIMALLEKADTALHSHLTAQGIDPRFFAFRWLTLLLSQQFSLPDCLRLWDSLLADEQRFDFLDFCCVAMIVRLKPQLIDADFSTALQMLQRYPPCDVSDVIELAEEIRLSVGDKPLSQNVLLRPTSRSSTTTPESEGPSEWTYVSDNPEPDNRLCSTVYTDSNYDTD